MNKKVITDENRVQINTFREVTQTVRLQENKTKNLKVGDQINFDRDGSGFMFATNRVSAIRHLGDGFSEVDIAYDEVINN